MKQHKTIFTVATMLLMAGGLLASCSSDDLSSAPVPEGNGESKVYTLSISTQKGGGSSQRVLTEGDNTIHATWSTTDKVYVKKGDSWFIGELQPQSAGASTILSGQIAGMEIKQYDVLTLQYLKKGDMNYDGQVGTLADISENFDYATAEVTVSSVDAEDNVYVTGRADFKNQQAILKLTLKDEDGNDINATQLKVTSGDKTYTVTPSSATNVMYVAVPAGAGDITLFAVAGQNRYIGTPGLPIVNGVFRSSTVEMKNVIEDAGSFVKVWISPTKAYFITKSDTQSGVVWSNDPSWGSKAQWTEIFTTLGGSDFGVLNSAVSNAGITGWTTMSGGYWSCTMYQNDAMWAFDSDSWVVSVKQNKKSVRTIIANTISVDGNLNAYTLSHLAGDIVDDGEYIKVYTSAGGGYRIPKSDTSSSVTWDGNVQDSWGSKEQWQEIFIACGGNANSGHRVLNDKVAASGISGWVAMSGYYWSCTERNSEDAWFFFINGWLSDFKSHTRNVRTVSAFTD